MVLYNCDFCEQGFIYRIVAVWPKAVLKCRADLNFSVTVKRSMISLSTSKVHDSILRKFVSSFWL